MDHVFIEALEVQTIVGVYAWERDIRQVLVLDVEMAWDTREAALTDELAATVDYHGVVKRLTEFIEAGRFQLVETVAERCAEILMNEFHVPRVRLRVAKPGAIKTARAVGVVIERQRQI